MIRILSDSTSDLGPELIERYGVTVLPLHVLLGDKDYRDGADITAQMIFDWKIPWTQESGGLQLMGPQRVRHN